MILKNLIMENFRSYAKAHINFPNETTLFEGDIGSGKSSILYAIEFALFGLGDMKGENLLRAGKDRGFVELSFDIGGKEHTIHRSLVRKGDSISQSEGYIISGGIKTEASPSELRARILDILDFKENLKTKSSSVIFRYAIFTPQEEMKEILRLKPEERLQTLRKAFGLEDYKIAKDNAKVLCDELKSRIKFIEGEISDVDLLIKQRTEAENKISSFRIKLNELKEKRACFETGHEKICGELRELENLRKEYDKISAQIPSLKRELSAKESELKYCRVDVESHRSDLDKINKRISELSVMQMQSFRPPADIEKEIKNFEKESIEKSGKAYEAKTKLCALRELIEKKICPTCKRGIEAGYYDDEISLLSKIYASCDAEAEAIRQRIGLLRQELKSSENFERCRDELNRLMSEKDRFAAKISATTSRIIEIEARITEITNELSILEKNAARSEAVISKISSLEKEKKETEENLRLMISEIGHLEGQIKSFAETTEKLNLQISQKLEQKRKKETYSQYFQWLSEFFVTAVESIEQQVLASINSEFSAQFQKWLSMLLEGSDINVKIDESFSPVVEQNGYEMDIESLSGGEKTSVAFAYRLALNLMVRKATTSMESNLLILDEPTDGFSKEQLSKVRDVLNELKCDQVILVSHERELEGFVDKIFHVEKRAGISVINEK